MKKTPPETVQQIAQLALDGLTQKQIAKNLSMSRDTVARIVKEHQIPIRDGRGASYRKEEFPCDICGKLFHEKRHRFEGHVNRTCSKECSSQLRSQANPLYAKINVICQECGTEFLTKPSRVKRSKYCSAACRVINSKLSKKNPAVLEEIKTLYLQGLTQEEIGLRLGKSPNTICGLFNKYSIGRAYNRRSKSAQEKIVLQMLSTVLGEPIGPAARYPGSNMVHDGTCSLGYIEYDGRGGHYRPDQISRDKQKDELGVNIVRLSPQAFHGKEPYIRWKLLGQRTGYVDSGVESYSVLLVMDNPNVNTTCNAVLRDCHPLEAGSGKLIFALMHGDHVIGAAKWGSTTDRNESGLELRRFLVLDGTPKNTESWFLNKCTVVLEAMGHRTLITYCHEWEKASYLLATGWKEIERKRVEYDHYLWNGKVFSRRTWWKWAKESGLVDKVGTKEAKIALANILGAEIAYEGTKRKFIRMLR